MRHIKTFLALTLFAAALGTGQAQPLSTLHTDQNIEKGLKLGENYTDFYFLGFNDKNKAIFIIDAVGKGGIYWAEPKTGKIIKALYQTGFDPSTARLSTDGKVIFASPGISRFEMSRPDILVIDSSEIKQTSTIKIGNQHTNVFIPHPLNSNEIVISLLESTWNEKYKDYAGDFEKGSRFEIWDWKQKKRLGAIKDEYASDASQIFLDANHKWLANFSRYSEDYDYPAAFRPLGSLDFLDVKTGQVKWSIEGNKSQTIGYPVAQLSPTQIISQSTIFEYPAKRIRPLQMRGERVSLLASVPGQPQKLMVATKRGAELWDYAKQKRLHRWPEIKNVNQIYFSPDLKFFATQTMAKHLYQFYRFDTKWMK